MKKTYILLLTTILLLLTGCEDKKSDEKVKIAEKTVKEKTNAKKKISNEQKEALRIKNNTFILADNNDTNHSVYVNNKNIEITSVQQEIVILNFFSTWCEPCKGQIPYISDLNKKYDNKIFVAAILVNDKIEKNNFELFKKDFNINYFISNSLQNDTFANKIVKNLKIDDNFRLPLTILFKNGKYYSHYEGAVPIEMLNHDIKNAMSKE